MWYVLVTVDRKDCLCIVHCLDALTSDHVSTDHFEHIKIKHSSKVKTTCIEKIE